MKVLHCPCGKVRIGVPRRRKFCSTTCPYARAAVLAQMAKNTAAQVRRARERLAGKSPREIFKAGYVSGWNMGYRRALRTLGRTRAA
jgi:hypothetical protein